MSGLGDREARDELWMLAGLACEGCLSSAQRARLNALLDGDAAAQNDYLAYMEIHGRLELGAAAPPAPQFHTLAAWVHEAQQASPETALPPQQRAVSPSPAPAARGRWHNLVGYLSQPAHFGVFFATLSTVSLLLFFAQVHTRSFVTSTPTPRAASSPAPAARVSGLLNCEWADDVPGLTLHQKLHVGQVIELRAGLVELTFAAGARTTIEGPAMFAIQQPHAARLDYGQLAARVDGAEARGFAVYTLHAVVVDLGTEFGVAVSPQGLTEVYVFEGQVQLQGRSTAPEFALQTLSAGDALRLDPQQPAAPITRTAAERTFVRQLPARPPREPGLVHQWTFNEDVRDSVGDARGVLQGGAEVFDGALHLDGVNDYLHCTNIAQPLAARTLVVWLTLANLEQRSGGALTVENAAGDDVFDSIVYGERVAGQWMNGSEFHLRSNEDNGGELESEPTERMLAIVYAPNGAITLYRDGERYAESLPAGVRPLQTYSSPTVDVLIGLRHVDQAEKFGSADGDDAFLAATIDEARIYNRALSADRIRALYRAGPTAHGIPKFGASEAELTKQ